MTAGHTTAGAPHDVVYLLDVDNTLLDNDRVIADLRADLRRNFGEASSAAYWAVFDQLRQELGYADYLGALQRYRSADVNDTRLLEMSFFLLDYPFEERLYPGALDVLRRLRSDGVTAILSDGDVVFQPYKIRRAGLWAAVDGRVLIYVHKDQMLSAVATRYPARHYVMVDDKLRILSTMKAQWKERLTTVFVGQGHYAVDPAILNAYAPADVAIQRIGDLMGLDLAALRGAKGRPPAHAAPCRR